jgi:hypothetical protein
MARLRAYWEVTAGVIVGTPEPEYSRRWTYTSDDYEADIRHADAGKDVDMNIFNTKTKEAHAWLSQCSDPRGLNWARLDFFWA